jgi:hypothetical protein
MGTQPLVLCKYYIIIQWGVGCRLQGDGCAGGVGMDAGVVWGAMWVGGRGWCGVGRGALTGGGGLGADGALTGWGCWALTGR